MITKKFLKSLYESEKKGLRAESAKRSLDDLGISDFDDKLQELSFNYRSKLNAFFDCVLSFMPKELKPYFKDCKMKAVGFYINDSMVYFDPTVSILLKNGFSCIIFYNKKTRSVLLEKAFGDPSFKWDLEKHIPYAKRRAPQYSVCREKK